MERFLWICLAGAAGTGARYLIAAWAAHRFGNAFPYGTLMPSKYATSPLESVEGDEPLERDHGHRVAS
jgi:hypothetical protein